MSAPPPERPDTRPDVELAAEQQHLARSRDELTRMRARTSAMDAAAAGDWVSREFLQSTFALRSRQLADDPTVPLFFGRLDHSCERFHIGRRHISDAAGDPMVIDWRAPVSLPFYRASRTEPMGVQRRRRYGFDHGRLTAYEDEDLTSAGPDGARSAILEAEIERPRVGPMRDIVATIQPEQDVIVRSDLATSICVQGAPGTGKTAVGLHRAAYLLYAHREQLNRQGVLVVGPNASFLGYIRDVLPALGEIDATQTTIEDLVTATGLTGRHEVRGTDPVQVAVLKGDARMAQVLRRALWSQVATPTESLVVPRGARRWRVPVHEAQELVESLRERGVRYAAARAMLPQALAHRILVAMENAGDSPDDRVQNAVARSKEVKAYAAGLWPALDPARLLWRLLSDPAFLAEAAEAVLEPDEQALLTWSKPPRAAGSAHWSLADAVLLDEAADLIERTPSLAHVVLDEAQDLSPMMLRSLARRTTTGSLTVLGDLAQATTPWASRSWTEALRHLGKPDAHVEELTRGFRVPGEVIEYAARLLPHIAPDLAPPTSVRRSRGELSMTTDTIGETVRDVVRREGSVGVIVPDARVEAVVNELGGHGLAPNVLGAPGPQEADPPGEIGCEEADTVNLDVVPASLAKGLEFDHVILVCPQELVAAEHDRVSGLRRLYVCMTRAVTSLVILPQGELPVELGEPPAYS